MPLTVSVDGTIKSFSAITQELGDALTRGVAIRPDGSRYVVTQFLGGFLLDGCPLNIILGQGWVAGQIDALKAAGIMPTCLVPGTLDYFAFYGNTGLPPIQYTPYAPAPTAPAPAPYAPAPTPVAPGAAPPVIQVTEQPYVPPMAQGTAPETPAPSTAPFGLEWSTVALIAVAIFLYMRGK